MNAKAFSLAELIVVIAIILILSVLIYPATINAIKKAEQTQCISNLRQIGLAFQMYMTDWNSLPYAKRHTYHDDPESIAVALSSYIDNPDVFICPSTEERFKEDFKLSYIYNVDGDLIDEENQVGAPTKSLVTDSPGEQWLLIGARTEGEPHPHFKNFADLLWLDGHVEAFWQEWQ